MTANEPVALGACIFHAEWSFSAAIVSKLVTSLFSWPLGDAISTVQILQGVSSIGKTKTLCLFLIAFCKIIFFRSQNSHFNFVPFPPFSLFQINYSVAIWQHNIFQFVSSDLYF